MRKLSNYLTIVAVALLITLLASDVGATGCRAVVVKKEIVVQKEVVVAAAVVAPVVATFVPVVYPLYGAVYQPGAYSAGQQGQAAQGQVDSDLSASVKALAEQVRVLSDKVGKVTGEAVPTMPRAADPPPTPAKPTDPFAPQAQQVNPVTPIVMARCASCHDAGKANTLGGKFVMTNAGKVKQLSGEELGKVIQRVASKGADVMPPPPRQMSEVERLQLISGVVSQ